MRPTVTSSLAVTALSSLSLLYLCPYTKVEESFTLHAIRDLLTYGVFEQGHLPKFDHVSFPGAVPRSFVGPLMVSGLVHPVLLAFRAIVPRMEQARANLIVQSIVRLGVLAPNVGSLVFLSSRVGRAFSPEVGALSLLFSGTSFHLAFYMSRTLPNMLAFPFVQVALGMLVFPVGNRRVQGKVRGTYYETLMAFGILVSAAIVLRLEVGALLGPLALWGLWCGTVRVEELVVTGLVFGGAAQALTVGIDSHFWGRTIWPEGHSLLFNVVEGQSSAWGVSPLHHYFTSALPKLLHFALPLSAVSMLVDRRARAIGFPALAFVALLSCIGHKEWRFVVYVVPVFHICAAASTQALGSWHGRKIRRLATFAVLWTNLVLGGLTLWASMANYPGGEALNGLVQSRSLVGPFERALKVDERLTEAGFELTHRAKRTIHLDSHARMTGATNFLHGYEESPAWFLPSPDCADSFEPWTYDKSEHLDPSSEAYEEFDMLVTGSPTLHADRFYVVAHPRAAHGLGEFAGFGFNRAWGGERGGRGWRKWVPLVRRLKPSVWIMRRREE